MASFNKWIGLGNLTRDPELKYLPSGTAVCSLSIACNRVWFDKQSNEKKEDVCYVEVSCFGKLAENCGNFLAKGRAALIDGRLALDQWNDKQTGEKRSKLKVVAENVTFIGGGKGDGGGKPTGEQQQPSGDYEQAASFEPGHQPDGDQEIPF